MRKLTLIKPGIYMYSVGFCFSCNNMHRKNVTNKLNKHPVFFHKLSMFLVIKGIMNIN